MNNLIGIWFFTTVLYPNPQQWIAAPTEDLGLRITFVDSARDELFYFHKNQRGYCRRWATYHIEGADLIQEVTDVDENNDLSCQQDSDMMIGTISKTPFKIDDGKLYLQLPVGEKTIQYIFERGSQITTTLNPQVEL